jgi:general stress protein 26
MKDRSMKCGDCGQEFAWTVGEQEFYHEKGIEDPKFCMICRAKHKAEERFKESSGNIK